MRIHDKNWTDPVGGVIQDALDRGWIWGGLTTNGHGRLRHPVTNRLVAIGDSSDPRAYKNAKSILRREEERSGTLPLTAKVTPEPKQEIQRPVPHKTLIQAKIVEDHVEAKTRPTTTPDYEKIVAEWPVKDVTLYLAVSMITLGDTVAAIALKLERSTSWVYQIKRRAVEENIRLPLWTDDDVLELASNPTPKISVDGKKIAQAFLVRHYALPKVSPLEKINPDTTLSKSLDQTSVIKDLLKEAKAAYDRSCQELIDMVSRTRLAGYTVTMSREDLSLKINVSVTMEEEL